MQRGIAIAVRRIAAARRSLFQAARIMQVPGSSGIKSLVSPAATIAVLLLAGSNHALAATAANAPTTPDPLAGLMLRTSLGLVAVLVLIFALAWMARRWGGALRVHGTIPMRVVSQLGVGNRERIVVVEVDETWLVVGVTAHGMRTLHTLPARTDTAPPGQSGAEAPLFLDRLQQALRRPRT